MTDYKIVLTTTDSREAAQKIAEALVNQRLAACVNILPGVQSIYRWEGKVEQATECVLIIKTLASSVNGLETAIEQLHPYDVPEFIVVNVESGSPPYLRWLADSVK